MAAQALLAMAQVYEKLGDPRALQTYEQVVRDFSDQPAVVSQARTRARPAGGAGMQARVAARLSWQEELYSRVSAGGRFLAYVNWWDAGDLYLRDLHSGSSRALTRESPVTRNVSVGGAAVSVDERRVAYSWEFSDHYELRVVDLSESGVPRSRVVMSSAEYLVPSDWTPDGKEILVERARPDRTRQIVAVDLASGNVRPLKTVDWRGTQVSMCHPRADSWPSVVPDPIRQSEPTSRCSRLTAAAESWPWMIRPSTNCLAGRQMESNYSLPATGVAELDSGQSL